MAEGLTYRPAREVKLIGKQVAGENVPRARAKAKRDWVTLTAKVVGYTRWTKMFGHLLLYSFERAGMFSHTFGDDTGVVPPVPIPNTVVKHAEADGTWLATAWESR